MKYKIPLVRNILEKGSPTLILLAIVGFNLGLSCGNLTSQTFWSYCITSTGPFVISPGAGFFFSISSFQKSLFKWQYLLWFPSLILNKEVSQPLRVSVNTKNWRARGIGTMEMWWAMGRIKKVFKLHWNLNWNVFWKGTIPVCTRLFRKGFKVTTYRLAANILSHQLCTCWSMRHKDIIGL